MATTTSDLSIGIETEIGHLELPKVNKAPKVVRKECFICLKDPKNGDLQ